MGNIVPMSVVLVGLVGLLVVVGGLARIAVLERRVLRAQRPAPVVVTPDVLPGLSTAA